MNIEIASAEYSLSVEYAKSWATGHEKMITHKYKFTINPGEIFWVCQKTISVDTYLGKDEITIQSEDIKINGDC